MKKAVTYGLAAILIFLGVVIGLTISSTLDVQSIGRSDDKVINKETPYGANAVPAALTQEISKDSVNALKGFGDALTEVVESVNPSVVNIATSRTVKSGNTMDPFLNDPFFRRFFGDEFTPKRREAPGKKQSGLGSGVIVSEDGFILTNNHVIKGADEIKVTLSDKSTHKGKVIGTDPKTDLALIQIDANNLPAIRWGNSDNLKVGEIVLAVGTPYGLNQTITMGIVSAVGRANVGIADYEDFIQTDAAINPGNSGGALVNALGQLVGINTAIFSTTGGYQGIGFAIPCNMARAVMNSLKTDGKVVRGWLGVTIQPVTDEIAEQFELGDREGTLVSDVMEDSPAAKAGLKSGDFITAFNGKPVDSPTTLRNNVAMTPPNSKSTITIIRDGKQNTIDITIGELPEDEGGVPGAPDSGGSSFTGGLDGVEVVQLKEEYRDELEAPSRVKGVVVMNIEQTSAAAEVLNKGDIIMEVNRQKTPDLKAFKNATEELKGDQNVLVKIFRKGSIFYRTLPYGN